MCNARRGKGKQIRQIEAEESSGSEDSYVYDIATISVSASHDVSSNLQCDLYIPVSASHDVSTCMYCDPSHGQDDVKDSTTLNINHVNERSGVCVLKLCGQLVKFQIDSGAAVNPFSILCHL